MLLKIYTKNMALKKELHIETQIIPRVGETLVFSDNESIGDMTHMVHDVTYLIGTGLDAVVSCHEANPPAHRKIILEEHGWV